MAENFTQVDAERKGCVVVVVVQQLTPYLLPPAKRTLHRCALHQDSRSSGNPVPQLRDICIKVMAWKLTEQLNVNDAQLHGVGSFCLMAVRHDKEDTREQRLSSSYISNSSIMNNSGFDDRGSAEPLTGDPSVVPITPPGDDGGASQDRSDETRRPLVEPFLPQDQEETVNTTVCRVLSIAVIAKILGLVWHSLANIVSNPEEEENSLGHFEERNASNMLRTVTTDEGLDSDHSLTIIRQSKADNIPSCQNSGDEPTSAENGSPKHGCSVRMSKRRKLTELSERRESDENSLLERAHSMLSILEIKKEESKGTLLDRSSSSADFLQQRSKTDVNSNKKDEEAVLPAFSSMSDHITPQFRKWVVAMLRSGGQQTDFTSEWRRLATFHNLQVPQGIYVLRLAQNGFFLLDAPENHIADLRTRVQCAFCGVRVPVLQFREAQVEEIHRRASPTCRFLSGTSSADNVAISGMGVSAGDSQVQLSPQASASASVAPFQTHHHQQQQQQVETLETDHCPESSIPDVIATPAVGHRALTDVHSVNTVGYHRPGLHSTSFTASRAKIPRLTLPQNTNTATSPDSAPVGSHTYTSTASIAFPSIASTPDPASIASTSLPSSASTPDPASTGSTPALPSSAFTPGPASTASTPALPSSASTPDPASTTSTTNTSLATSSALVSSTAYSATGTTAAVAAAAAAAAIIEASRASVSASRWNTAAGEQGSSEISPETPGNLREVPPSVATRDEESMEVSSLAPAMVVSSTPASDSATVAAASSTADATPAPRLAGEEEREEGSGGVGGEEGSSTNGSQIEPERQVVTYENLGIYTQRPKRPDMVVTQIRINTFIQWPHEATHPANKMAEAGFYYTGHQDLVRCFFCKGGLKTWEQSDQPWVEHCRWFPRCPFILLAKGEKFVEAVRTLNSAGSQPAISEDQVRQEVTRMEEDERRLLIVPPAEPVNVDPLAEVLSRAQLRPEVDMNEDTLAGLSERLEDEQDGLRGVTLCKMCQDEEVSILFLPCGHLVACAQCAPALRSCAVCRQAVKGSVRVRMAEDHMLIDNNASQHGADRKETT